MTNSTIDGLGFGEVNQNSTGTDTISGTNIYATKFIGVGGSIITGGLIYSSEDVWAKGRKLSTVGIGSPTSSWAAAIQIGSDVTSAGSLVWITYPTAYSAAPHVLATPIGAPVGIGTGSISTGSFIAYSIGASKPFTWLAAGSLT